MGADLPYYLTMWLLAFGVLLICGGGISYGYVKEGQWGQRRGEQVQSPPQKAAGVLPDPATGRAAEQDRDRERIAA